MSSSYRLELDRWLATLDVKAGRVLDIGGSQLPVKGRTKSWDVGHYQIADLPEPHVDSPRPEIAVDLNTEATGLEGDIDIVFCLEVFDYIWNPLNAMQEIARVLKNGGTAWVTFPAFYPHHQPIEHDALRYMEGGIRKLAASSGLEIVQMIRRLPETPGLERFWHEERMRAAKHYDHQLTGWIVEFKK